MFRRTFRLVSLVVLGMLLLACEPRVVPDERCDPESRRLQLLRQDPVAKVPFEQVAESLVTRQSFLAKGTEEGQCLGPRISAHGILDHDLQPRHVYQLLESHLLDEGWVQTGIPSEKCTRPSCDHYRKDLGSFKATIYVDIEESSDRQSSFRVLALAPPVRKRVTT